MKQAVGIGFSAFMLVGFSGLLGTSPSRAVLQQTTPQERSAATKQPQRGQVQLQLTVERQVTQTDAQGRKQITWQPLASNTLVQPGEVVRYTVNGKNTSDQAVKNLVITQPIPRSLVYILNSSTMSRNVAAEQTYSIDNGRNFVKTPTIRVKSADGKLTSQPAPASAYTHVRWQFTQPIAPGAIVTGSYQARVR